MTNRRFFVGSISCFGVLAVLGPVLFGWLFYSLRRLDEYNFKQFLYGSYVPAYRAKYHRWPTDLAQLGVTIEDVGPFFERRMEDIRDRSRAVLFVRGANEHEFRASVVYGWALGGKQDFTVRR